VSTETHATPGASDADADATEGRVYNVAGGDWDELVTGDEDRGTNEQIVVNMGPQHPSTHGVLRLVLTLEGETVTDARASIGYLHTGIEKNMEYRTWTQGTTFVTRADYLMPLFNEAAYCLSVERLLGIEDKLPERATLIRVLMLELNRIASHLGGIGPFGLELGATTIFLQGVRMRENVLDLFELLTGLRMNHAYIRPGGVAQDLPQGGIEAIRDFLRKAPRWIHDLRTLIDANPVFAARTKGIAYLDLEGCMALGVTGPMLRATGLPWDLRKSQPYLGYETYEFDVPTQDTCDTYGRYIVRMLEIEESLRIIEQVLDRLADRAPGRPRPVTRAHRAHHGPVHGGPHPPLQAGDRGLPGAGRPGLRADRVGQGRARLPCGQRRRHPALPGAPARPLVPPLAGRLRAVRRRQPRGRDPGDRVD
jgi:NADH-quinone oxidoreductase subunit D